MVSKETKKSVAILLCDEHYPEAIERFGHYSDALFGLFNDHFELAGCWNCHLGEFPKTKQDFDADIWVVSGSKYSVNDDDTWVDSLAELVRELDRREKRLFGICFGHQMIHKALGGRVDKRNNGFAVGLESVNSTLPKLPINGNALLFMHQEEVTQLAKGFKSVGRSEHCDNVVTVDGKGNLTMQCHPEFSVDFFTLLCERVEFENKQQIVDHCVKAKSQYGQESEEVKKDLNNYFLLS